MSQPSQEGKKPVKDNMPKEADLPPSESPDAKQSWKAAVVSPLSARKPRTLTHPVGPEGD